MARLPPLAPRRAVPFAWHRSPLPACRRSRRAGGRHAAPGGFAPLAGVPVEHLAPRVGRIHHEMPAVGDLHRRRRAGANALGVSARAVAADNSNALPVLPQPGGQCLAGAVGQPVDDTVALEVANDGAVAVTTPPCPVIPRDDAGRRCDLAAARADQPPQGITADRHRQPSGQARARLAAEGAANLLLDLAPPQSAPRFGLRKGQALGEDAAPAIAVRAADAPEAEVQVEDTPLPGQVCKTARIGTVDTGTRLMAQRARGAVPV